MTTTLIPTPEQAKALELFRTEQPLAIEALAGTGKTSTLTLLAHDTKRNGLYVAFNKSIVNDSAGKFPGTVTASTAHSLAFRTVGKRYAHRLKSARMRSDQMARQLGIDPFFIRYGSQTKVLQAGYLQVRQSDQGAAGGLPAGTAVRPRCCRRATWPAW